MALERSNHSNNLKGQSASLTANQSKNKQTGPKSEKGKKKSSKNAQQFGIFTKGYLASENHAALDLQYQALCQQWGATDPTRQIMVRSMHQAVLSTNRLALAQQQMIDAAMQSPNVCQDFARVAQIDALAAQSLPAWFFQGPDHPEKAKAMYYASVWDEADELHELYSDSLLAQVPSCYPALHHFVLEGQRSGVSFSVALGQRFKQSAPSHNLVALKNYLNERYPYHFLWAEDPERFEIFIAGIRGQQLYEGMDLEKSLRYYTAFQNLFHKGCQALDAMDRLEGKGAYAPVSPPHTQLAISNAPSLECPNPLPVLTNTKNAGMVTVESEHDGLQNEMPKDH